MDPSLEKLKDHDLLDYAKKLGIKNFGEYSGFPPRAAVIKELSTYFENNGKIEQKKKKKFKKEKVIEKLENEEAASSAAAETATRRVTRHNLTHTIEPALIETTTDEVQQPTVEKVKVKKRVKKTEAEAISTAENDATTTKTKKLKSKKTTASEPTIQEPQPAIQDVEELAEPIVMVKKTKNTKITSEIITKEPVENKKTTKKKLVKKGASSEVTAQIENENKQVEEEKKQEETKAPSPVKQEKKSKKAKAKKSPKLKKVKNAENVTTNSNDIIYDTNTNQSDDIPLRLTEEDEEVEQKNENEDNLSILTNDEDKPTSDENVLQNEESNVTKDILNRTFDKADTQSTLSTRLVVANISAMHIEDKAQNNQNANTTATVESSVSCVSFYNNQQQQQQTEEPTVEKVNKPTGAKITRPKQVATREVIVSDSKTQEVVAQKVVTEIIQREAGPTISKPPGSEAVTSDDIRKKTLKNKTSKVPDFKAMHEKIFEKSESIDEIQQRIQQRHDTLSTVPAAVPEVKKKVKPTVSSNKLEPLTKPSTSMTPIKKSKTSVSLINGSAQKNTHLTKLSKKPVNEPKTPVASNDKSKQLDLNKTPSSALKQKPFTYSNVQSSAQKHLSYKFLANADTSIDFSNGTAFAGFTTYNNKPMPNILATSSFQRRKSFDLNASLARPTNYKQYKGKIRAVELPGSTLGSQLKTTTNTNMNDTINRTISIKPTLPVKSSKPSMDPKRKSLSKQRKNYLAPDENNENVENHRLASKNQDVKKIRNKNVDKARNIKVDK